MVGRGAGFDADGIGGTGTRFGVGPNGEGGMRSAAAGIGGTGTMIFVEAALAGFTEGVQTMGNDKFRDTPAIGGSTVCCAGATDAVNHSPASARACHLFFHAVMFLAPCQADGAADGSAVGSRTV